MTVADVIFSRLGSRRALVTLSAILFLTFLDTTIMSVALEDLQATLHTTVSELQWIVNAYALLFAALMLAFGTLGDRMGRRKVMLAGVTVFVAGSIVGALAPNTETLIASRGIMGIGAAACEPGTLSILRQLYPDRRDRARALGIWAAIAGLALAMGPVIGGILVGAGGWRAIFWFNLAAGVLALAGAAWAVPESSDPERAASTSPDSCPRTGRARLVFAIIVGETAGDNGPTSSHCVSSGSWPERSLLHRKQGQAPCSCEVLSRAPSPVSVRGLRQYFGSSPYSSSRLYLQVGLGYTAYKTGSLFVPMAWPDRGLVRGRSWVGVPVAFAGGVGCFAAGAGVLLTGLARGEATPHIAAGPLAVPGGSGLRHRRGAHHLGRSLHPSGQTFGDGGLRHHHRSRGGDGAWSGGARLLVQHTTHRVPHGAVGGVGRAARIPGIRHHHRPHGAGARRCYGDGGAIRAIVTR